MNEHDISEYSYKNGYKAGVEALAKALKEYFPSIAKAIDHTAQEVVGEQK